MNDIQKMVIIPFEKMEELSKKVEKIYQAISAQDTGTNTVLSDYISEEEAKQQLSRGTTWFYNQRKMKLLTPMKMGRTNFYKKTEITNLLVKGD